MTRYEKRALGRFRIIYLGSLFTLASVIAFLVYQNRYASMLEMEKYKMQHYASGVSSYIIATHMHNLGKSKDKAGAFQQIPREEGLKVALFDDDKTPVYREFDEPVRLGRGFYESGGNLYLVSRNTYMHLNVEYVAVKAMGVQDMTRSLQREVLLLLLFSLLIIAGVGYYLSRLFMLPVREEINRIDRFIKDTTHELNTPVSAILMSVSLLKKMAVDPKVVRRIELSAKRVSDIYNDLTYLFFSDLNKKQITPVAWDTLIAQRIEYYRDFAGMKQITFVRELEDFAYPMDGESAVRLIDNLISNAIKYNRIGGTITVSLNGGRLTVRDNGIGMDEAAQKEVFKRYKRVNDVEGGFGVGLDIVASICREYGIDIAMESEKDIGTVITLTF